MNINIKGSINTMDFFSNVLEKFDKTMPVFNAFGCKLEHIEKNTTSRVLQIVESDTGKNLFTALLDLEADSARLHIGLPLNYDIETAVNMHQILIKLNNSIAMDNRDYEKSKIEIIEFPKITILISNEIIIDIDMSIDIFVNNIFDSLFSMIQLVLSFKATIEENTKKLNEKKYNTNPTLSEYADYMLKNPDIMLEKMLINEKEKQKQQNAKSGIGCISTIAALVIFFIILSIMFN